VGRSIFLLCPPQPAGWPRGWPPAFSAHGRPLTRFGIYKIVRRHAGTIESGQGGRTVSPHVFRHTTAGAFENMSPSLQCFDNIRRKQNLWETNQRLIEK
jgi:integrase